MNFKPLSTFAMFFLLSAGLFTQEQSGIPLRNLARIEGVRENQLSGFGLVTGLAGQGDSPDSVVLKQVLTNLLAKYQLSVPSSELKSKNCAAVLITADIPPFVRSGERIPAYVSSIGDAKSLEGGILLQSPLYGADNILYAVAQGIVENTAESPNRTVGHLVRGAMVERQISSRYINDTTVSITLNKPDFSTAFSILTGLRDTLPEWNIRIKDAGSVTLQMPDDFEGPVEEIFTLIENTEIGPPKNYRIIVNPRTGVVVAGADAGIGTVGVAYKGAKIEVNSSAFATDKTVESFLLNGTVQVEELIHMLQELGIDARGIIEILIAIDRAGALYGELVVM